MKVGDLVHYVKFDWKNNAYSALQDTSGIVLGFHPTIGSVRVHWFTMAGTPTPNRPGYWPWGNLKVYSKAKQ